MGLRCGHQTVTTWGEKGQRRSRRRTASPARSPEFKPDELSNHGAGRCQGECMLIRSFLGRSHRSSGKDCPPVGTGGAFLSSTGRLGFAPGWRAAGYRTRPGDRMAILLPNSLELAVTVLAASLRRIDRGPAVARLRSAPICRHACGNGSPGSCHLFGAERLHSAIARLSACVLAGRKASGGMSYQRLLAATWRSGRSSPTPWADRVHLRHHRQHFKESPTPSLACGAGGRLRQGDGVDG